MHNSRGSYSYEDYDVVPGHGVVQKPDMIGKMEILMSEGSTGLSQFGAIPVSASDLRVYSYFFLEQDCDRGHAKVYLRTSRSDGPLRNVTQTSANWTSGAATSFKI